MSDKVNEQEATESPAIKLSAAPQVNFACQQNAVPVIRELRIVNPSEMTLYDLTLEMEASPGFLAPKKWNIDRLNAGMEMSVSDRDVRLEGGFLFGLQEKQQGELRFRLVDGNGLVVAEERADIEVLARNEWGGYGSSPELLAAFCMPNEPSVDKLLRAVSDRLRASGQEGTLSRYDNGTPERIWIQASAAWSVVSSLKLDYAYPPASFERTGQKIRTPDLILESQRATCLDTTLLLCSLFEQTGLHPVIILERGHAYAGLWLVKNEGFPHAYTEDLLAVRKRVQLKELIVFETTLLCRGARFKQAIEHAENSLMNDNDNFIGIIDISRARDQRIFPLSLVADANQANRLEGDVELDFSNDEIEVPDNPETLGGEEIEWQNESVAAGGRLAQWQRRLLDLSLRNPLLNMKNGKTCFPLIAPDMAVLEDYLAAGRSLTLEPFPSLGERDEEIHNRQRGEKLEEEMAAAALQRGKVYVPFDPKKLESSMIELYRKARNDMEEGGANTLFLALGVLHWTRPSGRGRVFRAPLVLVPITLERKSVRSGIKISLSDDEVRFNTTLLELLRQDFNLNISGLDGPLPDDHSGTDVNLIVNKIRREIRDVPDFEVRNEVFIGTFSFAKYLMWKDLVDRTDQLKDNPVVRHLIETPKDPFREAQEFVDPATLDYAVAPEKLFTPLSSDSSQLAAVVASATGKNFVMLGPPGTGKSQTISNMIAHNLGLGRTVLFVSEKAAALDVVHRRLKEQGLGEFCLELHSNKAKKLDVIRQLGEAWGIKGDLSDEEWKGETGKLQRAREELNQFVQALHEVHRNGMSVRQGIGILADGNDVPRVSVQWENVDEHTAENLQDLQEICKRVDLNLKEVGEPAGHFLSFIKASQWSLEWQREILENGEKLLSTASTLQEESRDVSGLLKVPETTIWNKVNKISEFLPLLLECAGKNVAPVFDPQFPEKLSKWDGMKLWLEELHSKKQNLSVGYDESRMFTGNLAPAQEAVQTVQTGWWGARFFANRKGRGYLSAALGASGKANLINDVPLLKDMQSLYEKIQREDVVFRDVPGWNGIHSDCESIEKILNLATRLRAGIAALAETPEELAALRIELRKLVVDANDMLAATGVYNVQINKFLEAKSALDMASAQFAVLAGTSVEDFFAHFDDLKKITRAMEELPRWQNKLHAWSAWCRVKGEAEKCGLKPLISALESGAICSGDTSRIFLVNYLRWWAGKKFDASQVLREFVSIEHEEKIRNFRAVDDKVRKITGQYIRSRIRKDLADQSEVKKTSEFGIIRRELEKKTRHKPLRQLLSEAPQAVMTLTPCLLMSPLSIAQYLPPDQKPFDVVIFDEASQITVWDAIGAIGRGKQTIMVGDPKQLPPTSFFATGANNDEDLDDEDLESILDELIGANLPALSLSWHYRSRNESLITFSNHRYYKGELVTFPSPITKDRAVSLEHVGGVYERGSSQTNRMEAERIVAEIEKRLTNSGEKILTMGVVTFNQKQQTLILDLLEEARGRNPELDKHFAEDLIEPVFVKNLESVQGDERDIIFFSTTFGPDKNGMISMNFGPLNKSGGERRLNVAITRARHELKVFSSIRGENIDLSRTAALGVRDFKHFLEFAEKGSQIFDEAVVARTGEFRSPMEKAIAEALQQKGWTIHPEVGVSKFRVDLGVVDPRHPGRYLAGIECDGETYRRSATARDRDMIRESVLQGLGWKTVRVWATDYWINPEDTIAKLDKNLKSLLD